ncbi:MAG TPA: hypothetical protein VF036_01075, partial [Actinomycetota bacterium]
MVESTVRTPGRKEDADPMKAQRRAGNFGTLALLSVLALVAVACGDGNGGGGGGGGGDTGEDGVIRFT